MNLKFFEKCLPFLLFALALFLSLYHLEDSPRTWFDEGIYLHIGKMIATYGSFAIQIAPSNFHDISLISVGYPLLLPLALVFKIFGASLLAGRLLMVGFILGFLCAAYLFVKSYAGRRHALITLALLVLFSPLYGNGKNVLGEIPGLMYLSFASYFLFKAEKSLWRFRDVLLSGLFFGLTISTKPTFLPLLPALFVAYLIHRALKKPPFRITLRSIVTFSLSLLLPLSVWLYSQFNWSISVRDIFRDYFSPAGNPNPWINAPHNLWVLVSEATPLHFLLLFLIVVIAYVLRWRTRTVAETVLVFFSVFIFINFFKMPAWYRYFFLAHIPMIMLFSESIFLIIERIIPRKKIMVCGGVLLILVGLQTVRLAQNFDRFYYPAWREMRDHVLASTSKKVLYFNVSEGAFFSPNNEYGQVLHFRPGLQYGNENLARLPDFDEIIVRDSDWEEVRKLSEGIFKESEHFGNYYIFTKL